MAYCSECNRAGNRNLKGFQSRARFARHSVSHPCCRVLDVILKAADEQH
jgi:hypothetical protein